MMTGLMGNGRWKDGTLTGQARDGRSMCVFVQTGEDGRFRAVVRIGEAEQPLGSFISESVARRVCEGYFRELCDRR